jgi:hypothetical protein
VNVALGFAKQPEPVPTYGAILRSAQQNKLHATVLDGIRFSQDEYLQDILLMSVVDTHEPVQAMMHVAHIESPTHLAMLARALKEQSR